MTDKAVNVAIGIKSGDTSGLTAVESLSENIERADKAIAEARKQGGLSGVIAAREEQNVAKLTAEILRLNSALQLAETSMQHFAPEDAGYKELEAQAAAARSEIERLNDTIAATPSRLRGGDLVGRGESAVMNIAGLAGGLGATGTAGGLQIAGDVLGTTDALKNLGDVLIQNEGIIGRVASAGASLLAPLGATASGLGAVLAVAGPLALAGAGIAAIFTEINRQAEEGRRRLQESLSATELYYQVIATGSKGAAEDAIETLTQQQTASQLRRDDLKQLMDDFGTFLAAGFRSEDVTEMGAALRQRMEDLGLDVASTSFQDFVRIISDEITRLEADMESASSNTRRLQNAIDTGLVTETQDATTNVDALGDAISTLSDIAKQRADLVAQFNQQENDLLIDRRNSELDALEDAKIAEERRFENHQKNLQAIEQAGQAAIEAIRARGLERLKQFDAQTDDLNQRLTELDNQTAKAREKVNKDFMRREIEALEKFIIEEKRRTDQQKKERLRALEDLHNSLLDAEERNDVVAFIQAQRAGEQNLRRMQEDQEEENRQRQEDFQRARETARAEREARLAELEELAADRRADIEKQIEERGAMREAIIAEIRAQEQAERDRIKATQAAQIAAFKENERLLEEDAERRLKRQLRDQDIADERRLRAHNVQLAALDEQEKKQLAIINGVADGTGKAFSQAAQVIQSAVGNAIAHIQARAAALAASSFGSSGSNSGSSFSGFGQSSTNPSSGFSGTAFQNEGVVTKPTFALIGDRLKPDEAEAVVKFRPSEGLPARFMGSGGPSIQVSIASISVGGEVTRDDIEGVGMDIARGILQGMANAVSSTGRSIQVGVN